MCSASGRAQLPCTTPASQLGILHGTVAGVPAFRWYDRELGRVLIANRPDDAAIIEQRATTGAGLLADDGLALGNLFTGDAPRAILTMSRLGGGRGSAAARQTFAWFLTNPNGFTRGVVRTVAEVVKERWQAARQNRLNVLPRVHRGWTFAGLRAATNVLQRDLNTAVIAEEMRKGTKSIYVDYVDYDEIAHHAGMFRPESLAALDGLDRVLGTLERLATHAARRYHIVVLSDHGQSQGQTFRDRFGADLGEVCTQLMEEKVASLDAPVEGWGRVESLAEDLAGSGLTGRAAGRAAAASRRHVDEGAEAAATADVSVLGSGNLGLLYVHSAVRLTLEDLQERWPNLVPGLCAHEGIGFIAGLDTRRCAVGPRCEHGRVRLDTGEVTGEDPLAAVRRPRSPGAPARGRDAGGPRPVHQQPRRRRHARHRCIRTTRRRPRGSGRLAGPSGTADPAGARGRPAHGAHRRCRPPPRCAGGDAPCGRPAQNGARLACSTKRSWPWPGNGCLTALTEEQDSDFATRPLCKVPDLANSGALEMQIQGQRVPGRFACVLSSTKILLYSDAHSPATRMCGS